MELFVSKLLPQLIYPLGLFIWLTIAGGVLAWLGRRRLGVAVLSVAVVVLWVASTPVFSGSIRAGLECSYLPVPVSESPVADAIVVLGGAVRGPAYPRVDLELGDGADRVLHAARLYRTGKAVFVIATGGNTPWLGGSGPEASAISKLLQEWGVPEDAIILESDSANTRENAINTKRILEGRDLDMVLLVTSALHMPRALVTFHGVGVNAAPSPTDYEVVEKKKTTVLDFLPDAEALEGTTRAMREYLGYAVYWMRGWI